MARVESDPGPENAVPMTRGESDPGPDNPIPMVRVESDPGPRNPVLEESFPSMPIEDEVEK